MATFSVTEAATAGFGVIGRRPLAVVGWALALAIGMIIPAILGFLALGPQFQQMMQMAMTQKEGAPAGHGHGHGGPAATDSEIWGFEVVQRVSAQS